MKRVSNEEMKQILGGIYDNPPMSSCSVKCRDGYIAPKDCGNGVDCFANTDKYSITCGQTEYCVCDGHDIPKT